MRPHGSPEVLEARRQIAARLLRQGMSLTEVAAPVEASVSSVHRWREALERNGSATLASQPHLGPRPRLSQRDLQRLLAAFNSSAEEWGFLSSDWTCARMQELIERLFHVHYHDDLCGCVTASHWLDSATACSACS